MKEVVLSIILLLLVPNSFSQEKVSFMNEKACKAFVLHSSKTTIQCKFLNYNKNGVDKIRINYYTFMSE